MRFEKLWLKEINATADYLLLCYNAKITKARLFTIEKRINTCLLNIRQNYGFYIRKNEICDLLTITFYPINDNNADIYDFGKRYKIYSGVKKEIRIRDICNQFIHADIFSHFIPTSEGSLGIFLASDSKKENGLYYIQMCKIVQILKSIGSMKNISIEVDYNESTRKYELREMVN